MKLSSVASGSGWRGPNYVHVLDRPFRLYQLSEFSVIGELIQSSSSYKGEMYVGLFDENKRCVLLTWWYDMSSSKSGYFKTIFYPQYYDSGYQSVSCGASSFTKTSKLWWDEGFGGDGAIYSTIDGSGSAYPIGECDNASRVIKYVVLYGTQYYSTPLVDARVHDINVVADLNRHNPNAPNPDDPVEFDGTGDGAITSSIQVIIEELMITAMDLIDGYWTGWWPVFHLVISWFPFADVCLSLHITIDLLLNIDVSLDGVLSLLVPFLEDQGIVGATAVQETESAVFRLRGFHDVLDPWEISDWCSIFTCIAGMFAGMNAVATGIWLVALAAWWLSLVNAISIDYQAMVDGVLQRYDVGLQCVQKGLQYMVTGGGGLYAGIKLNQAYNERVLSDIADSVMDDNPAKEIIDDTVAENVFAGILQMTTGFAVVIIGVLIWSSII